MLRKSLLLTAALCFLVAPMAMAAGNSLEKPYSAGQSSEYGLCMTGIDGQGEVIPWATSESQCQYSTTAGSWVENGIVKHSFNQNR